MPFPLSRFKHGLTRFTDDGSTRDLYSTLTDRLNLISVPINGGPGDDTLIGSAGDDMIFGNGGSDFILADKGNDQIQGNAGDDALFGENGNDTIHGGSGDDQMSGGDGNDKMSAGSGDDFAAGGNGNDILSGNAGIDTLRGNDGNDTIRGGEDTDFLLGENGDDRLSGEAGEDFLFGGTGTNQLTGGADADGFIFNFEIFDGAPDHILDFSLSQGDVLHLDHILIGFGAGDDIDDFVTLTQNGADMSLSIDRDGAGLLHGFKSVVVLHGVNGLSVQDLYDQDQIVVS